jgi:outer membrane protein OmpA-like peptidoglycan-associated protein
MRFAASRLAALAMLGAATIALSACSDLDLFGDDSSDLGAATGSPFTQALAHDYSDLAAQAAALPAPPSTDDGFFSPITNLFDTTETPGDLLQHAFNTKAELATSGQEPQPEAAPDPAIAPARDRLIAAITAGKAQFPEESARAQADYDCWVLFGSVASAASASVACKSQLDTSLPHLESIEHPAPPPAPAPVTAPPPAPVASAPIAPASPASGQNEFTVYFDFDSWTLTAEDLSVMTNVINTARAGAQAHITVVGHTDTSGSAAYNLKLSVRRANVVVEALVDMGARRAAITASGVGKTDLAVQTGDGVKEAKNRRTVIDLKP